MYFYSVLLQDKRVSFLKDSKLNLVCFYLLFFYFYGHIDFIAEFSVYSL